MKLFTRSKTRYSTFSDQLEKAKESANSISKSTTILKNTFIKRSKLKRKSYLNQQKKEKIKKEKTQRSVKERQLEKPSAGFKSFLGSTGSKIKKASGNVFEAIMYLLVGWLINKLPEIIEGVRKIYNRIKKVVNVLKSFIGNLKNWFVGIGDVVNQAIENFRNFDFLDSKGKLKAKLEELENSWNAIQNDIENGKTLLTTPLNDEEPDDKQTPSGDLFDIIASGEGDYNSVNRGRAGDSPGGASRYFGKDLTQMTVGEVMDLQRSGQLFAAGKYQIIPQTMKGFVSSSGISMTDLFDSRTQEKFKKYVTDVKRPAVGQYLRGESENKLEAAQELAREFASIGLAYPEAGRQRGESRYSGTGGNKASISPESIESALEKSRKQQGGPQNRAGASFGGSIIEYLTGDPRMRRNYDYSGHGTTENYHDHFAFSSVEEKDRAKRLLESHGIEIGSQYRDGDPGYHGRNLAFDVPGHQWGGKGPIGKTEYDGSARVRAILASGGFFGSGIEAGPIPAMTQPKPFNREGVNQTIRKGRKRVVVMVEENDPVPQVMQGSGSSQIVVVNPLNSFIKNQFFLDLAYT